MSFGDLPVWAQLATQITAIAGAVLLLARLVRPVWNWACSLYRRIMGLFAINAKIDKILHEVTTNNGGSLKDAVRRTESKVDFLSASRRATLNAQPVCRAETDSEGHVTWASPAFQKLVGRPEKELLGSGWVNIMHPGERSWAEENWAKAVKEQRVFEEEHTYVTTDGAVLKVRAQAQPMFSADGTFLGHIAEITPL